MATNIFNYNGTLATTIADGALDSTTSLAMPGRGYINYGEPVNQNMLWIMQNFANSSSPANPTAGQLWFNTNDNTLNVYNGTAWTSAGGAVVNTVQPTGLGPSNAGATWFDNTNKQLYIWSGTDWLLVGPLASTINTDPINPSVPAFSQIRALRLLDTNSNTHQAWEIIIGGTVVALFSKDATYNTGITGFTTVSPGLTFNSTITGAGVASTTNFTSVQNNLPSTDNTYNMGSSNNRFANMYAVTFNGTATSALYADLAERYHADAVYDAGTVLCLGGACEVSAFPVKGSEDVFGVVSTNPATLMNSGAGDNQTHPPVALTGRVPCKVIGPVRKGQRLMTSDIPGYACAWTAEYSTLAILGRALQDKTTNDIELIEITIGKN